MDQDYNKMSRADLEVQSRRMESELAVLRNRSYANPEGFKKSIDDRTKNYQTIQKRIREIDNRRGATDPEGTSQTLSDAEGRYASDARAAAVGGVGINNSNSDTDGVVRRQRKQLEDQGIDPEQVPQNQMAGVNQGDGGSGNQSSQSDTDKSDQSKEQQGSNDPAQQPKKK